MVNLLTAYNMGSLTMIVVGVVGGGYCFFMFSRGYYESALPGICCWMSSLLEGNYLFAKDQSYTQLLAGNVVDIGLIFCVCVFLHRLSLRSPRDQ